ncbi:hypothetical protein Fmac_025554 [Flemingia macrophylla]|uniref:Uncharacterized protein n=1 Tax=Flemingia macrophylla TaxID=520843 RepID=A0ABD1LSP8_9FABA
MAASFPGCWHHSLARLSPSLSGATELVGIVAMSVGRVGMEPILPPYIEAAICGFGLEYSELRAYTHGFFSNVAEILDDSFAQVSKNLTTHYSYILITLTFEILYAFSSCNLDS